MRQQGFLFVEVRSQRSRIRSIYGNNIRPLRLQRFGSMRAVITIRRAANGDTTRREEQPSEQTCALRTDSKQEVGQSIRHCTRWGLLFYGR